MESGDAVGGTEKKLGKTADAEKCIVLVKKRMPSANGISWSTKTTDCYAEFKALRVDPKTCPHCFSCVFSGRLIKLKTMP